MSERGLGLDLGCGSVKDVLPGPGPQWPALRWIGVDIAELGRYYQPGDFLQHDLSTPLPFPPNSFDMAWSHHMLEHLPHLHPRAYDPNWRGPQDYLLFVINEVWRLLKPGHDFHIVVPQREHTNAWRCPTHYRFFDEGYFRWFSYNFPGSDHECMGLYSKWQVVRSEIVGTSHEHVYGILRKLVWEGRDESAKHIGNLSVPDWGYK